MPKNARLRTKTVIFLLLLSTIPALSQFSQGSKLVINSVVHSARKILQPGDNLHVIMTGSPGGTAKVEILGLSGDEKMQETSNGRYEADITIPQGLDIKDGVMMVTLQRSGNQVVGEANRTVTIAPGGLSRNTIGGGNNNQNNTRNNGGMQTLKPAGTSQGQGSALNVVPANGAVVSQTRPQIGASFTSSLQPQVKVVINNVNITAQAVDDGSDWNRGIVRLKPQFDLKNGTQNATITVRNTNGQTLTHNWSFTVNKRNSRPTTPTHRLSVANIQNGMLLGNNITVQGTGIPGSSVMCTVKYPKKDFLAQLAGINLSFQGQATVDNQGRYSIGLDAGQVRRGEPMTMTVTDSRNSTSVTFNTKKGDPSLRQANVVNTPNTTHNQKPVVNNQKQIGSSLHNDNQNNYSMNIVHGWSQETGDPNFVLKVNKGRHTTVGISIVAANNRTVDETVNAIEAQLLKQGGTLHSRDDETVSGIKSKRLVMTQAQSEMIFFVTPHRSRFYVFSVESTQLTTDNDLVNEIDHMFESYKLR